MVRILVAEDDHAIRDLLDRLLRRMKYDVVVAADGPQAWSKLEADRYDAVVLDLMLPKLSGHDIIERLRESRPDLLPTIVVVTASMHALKKPPANIAALLMKPFDLEELLEAIRRVVERAPTS